MWPCTHINMLHPPPATHTKLNKKASLLVVPITVRSLLCQWVHLAWYVASVVRRIHSQSSQLVTTVPQQPICCLLPPWKSLSRKGVDSSSPTWFWFIHVLWPKMVWLLQQGLIIWFWHETNCNDNALYYLGGHWEPLWTITHREVANSRCWDFHSITLWLLGMTFPVSQGTWVQAPYF